MVGCDCAPREELARIQTERDSLRKEQDALRQQIALLTATDQGYWVGALALEKSDRLPEAILQFRTLAERFPRSPLVQDAMIHIQKDETEISRRQQQERIEAAKLEEEKGQEAAHHDERVRERFNQLAALIRKSSATNALQQLEDFSNSGKNAPIPSDVAVKASSLSGLYRAKAEQEEEKRKNDEQFAALGIQILEFTSYWTADPNVLGGKELLIPYLRFKVKNVGTIAISSLVAKASFELPDKKEVLGEGSSYPIGTSDPPLSPGYTREVFFGSGTGYTSWLVALNPPYVRASVYLEVNGSQQILVKTVPISKELK
jgi:hypothetical protein